MGLLATTNPGGAGKWRLEYSKYLTGFDVVLLPDNDDAGRQHAHHVAQCLRDNAASVRIVELGGLPEKGDVSDWIDGGASQSDFETLLDLCPPFEFGNTLDDPIPPQFSDEALALEFSSLHADKLRYVALWGKWVLWGATHWQREETLKAFDLARAVCRAASAQITDPKAIK